jgi:hypothetical protein
VWLAVADLVLDLMETSVIFAIGASQLTKEGEGIRFYSPDNIGLIKVLQG